MVISRIEVGYRDNPRTIKIYYKFIDDSISNYYGFKAFYGIIELPNYFSFYKGAPVIKHYIKNDAVTSWAIFGIMFINGDDSKLDRGIDTIKHEWGHFVQEKYYGELLYLIYIAYPSVTHRGVNYYYYYYSQPWEYGADAFGGVKGYPHYTSDASSNFIQYHNEIMEARRKIRKWIIGGIIEYIYRLL